MIKIGIIIVYFGNFPDYLSYFFASCGFNRKIRWFLFSDQEKPTYYPKNFIFNYLDISNFNKLASEKLGFPVKINDPYKLCDFKPAYGRIFEDYMEEYDFWGYCDADIIFGRISQFLTDKILEHYDIISGYSGFLSGPFCLFKNNELTGNLFRNCPDHRKILQNPVHFAFDENVGRKDFEGIYFKKIIFFIFYAVKNLLFIKKYKYSLNEFRYQFQWYFKRKNITGNNPADMTEAVFEAERKKEVNASFSQMILSDNFFRRVGRKKWMISWESGKLTDTYTGKEVFAFHFPVSKCLENFKIDTYNLENNSFIISESGIKNG